MKLALLDTDTLSYYLFKDYPQVNSNYDLYCQKQETLFVSRPTIFEIESGLLHKKANKKLKGFDDFLQRPEIEILELDEESAHISAKIRADLRKKGRKIGINDLYIAGIAIKHKLVLVTNNTKHYQDIENLEIENWA